MNYILDVKTNEKFFLVINGDTGREICKISKKVNTKEDIIKQFPEIKIKD